MNRYKKAKRKYIHDRRKIERILLRLYNDDYLTDEEMEYMKNLNRMRKKWIIAGEEKF